jgi:hypothetical protein
VASHNQAIDVHVDLHVYVWHLFLCSKRNVYSLSLCDLLLHDQPGLSAWYSRVVQRIISLSVVHTTLTGTGKGTNNDNSTKLSEFWLIQIVGYKVCS